MAEHNNKTQPFSRSLATHVMSSVETLNTESAETLSRMAFVAATSYADAIERLQAALPDRQPTPILQQRLEAFHNQIIDPLLQQALGATFFASAEQVYNALTQQSLPPLEPQEQPMKHAHYPDLAGIEEEE